MNRASFPKEKHQNSQKWAKFMNFSFWPFLWFGLPGPLLIFSKEFKVSAKRKPLLVWRFPCFFSKTKHWHSAKRACVKRVCPHKVVAHMWFMHDAHFRSCVLVLDILAEYT